MLVLLFDYSCTYWGHFISPFSDDHGPKFFHCSSWLHTISFFLIRSIVARRKIALNFLTSQYHRQVRFILSNSQDHQPNERDEHAWRFINIYYGPLEHFKAQKYKDDWLLGNELDENTPWKYDWTGTVTWLYY